MEFIFDLLGTILVDIIFDGIFAAASSDKNPKVVRCILALILAILMLALGALTVVMIILSVQLFTGTGKIQQNIPIGILVFIVGLLMGLLFIKFIIKMINIYHSIIHS